MLATSSSALRLRSCFFASHSSLESAMITSRRFCTRSNSSFAASILISTSRKSIAALKDKVKSATIYMVSTKVTTESTPSGMANTSPSTGLCTTLVISMVNPPHANVELRQICPWKLNFWFE